jgi:alpha-mannosidase
VLLESRGKMSKNQDLVIDYLMANYYDDVERMAKIKMVASIANSDTLPFNHSVIDKIALFNDIKKSYPPKVEEVAKEFIEGMNFIMFLGKTAETWKQ